MKNFILAILMMLSAGAYASGVSSTSNYNPAAVTITGGSGAFTGEVSATGGTGGKITLQASTGDVIATRAGGASGGIFFNTAKTSYLYFDSTQLLLIGGAVNVPSLTTTGSVSAGSVTAAGTVTGANVVASGVMGTFSGVNVSASGAITGASVAATGGVTSSSPAAGVGYTTGSGGTVSQITNISTSVTLHKVSGRITTVNNAFVAGVTYSFFVNNAYVGLGDAIIANGDDIGIIITTASEALAGGFSVVLQCVTTITTFHDITFVVIKGSRN